MTICLLCSKKLSGAQKKFCSKSCAAILNNKKYPKRSLGEKHFCQCGNKKNTGAKRCRDCWKKDGIGEKTLGEIADYKYSGSLRWHPVRGNAVYLMRRWNLPKKCFKCEWDKHVEVDHKIKISNFPLDTLIKVVNSRENLCYLCPNCHWEKENGALV